MGFVVHVVMRGVFPDEVPSLQGPSKGRSDSITQLKITTRPLASENSDWWRTELELVVGGQNRH